MSTRFYPVVAAAMAVWLPMNLFALSGTWNITGNGSWGTAASWTSSTIADGATYTASFTKSLTVARTVTLDSARTIGTVTFTPGGSSSSYTVAGTFPLTLDAGVGVIAAVRSTQVTNFCNVVLLGGASGVKMPDKGFILSLGATNAYTGDTYIESQNGGNNGGTLRLGINNALPHGPGKGNVYLSLTGAGDGALDLFGFSTTVNGLAGGYSGGQVKNAKASTLSILTVGDNDATSTFDGVITDGAGLVGLTKIGTGTLTLSGSNGVHNFTGPTTITGGKLKLDANAALSGSSSIGVGSGGTLDVTTVTTSPYPLGSSQSLAGLGGGTGNIDGSVTLDPASGVVLSYSAGSPSITVLSGTLTLNGNAITVNVAGSSPLLDGSYKLIAKSGAGSVAGTVGSLTLGGLGMAGGGTPTLSIVGGELFLNITGGAPGVEWGPGSGIWADNVTGWNSGGASVFTNGNVALLTDTFATANPTITLNTTVLPQSVVVSATNNYTVTGTGSIGGAASLTKLGIGSVTFGTTNTYTGGTTLIDGTLNVRNPNSLGDVSATLTIKGGTLDNTSGSPLTLANYPQTWAGSITFAGSSDLNLGAGPVTMTAGRIITVNSTAKLTVGGDISGSGFSLVKSGTGILQLDGNNTITASSTLNLGEVIIGNDGALNGASGLSLVFPTDANSKILSLNGHNITIRSLIMGIISGGTATVIRNNHPSIPATLTVNPNAAATYAGTITDGGAATLSLVKDGIQNWTFGGGGIGVGTYSGDTTISGGTLTAGANNILPYGVGKGNLIVSSGATFDILDRSAISINGLSGGGTVNRSNPGGSATSTLTVGNADASGTFSGRIRTTGTSAYLNLVKTGTGTQILAGANDYSGLTTVNGGILQIGAGGTSGSLTSTSIVNNATLVFNRDGNMTYAGILAGPGPFTNAGPGIVTLTGISTLSGPTTVTAGTLRVNSPGSLPATSTVLVKTGGAIGGTGTINGPVTVESGGTLAPGASIGTLTINNTVTLQGATVMEVSRDGGTATSDRLTGVTTLNYGGDLIVTNIGITSLRAGDSFILFSATIKNPGFANVTLPPLLPGLTWNNTLNASGTLSISGTVIPPNINSQSLAGDTLTMSGTGGVAGGSYYVLTSLDVSAPIGSWTPIATNVFDNSGNFSFQQTAILDQPQQYYMIAIP